jgi:streptogramin lyase
MLGLPKVLWSFRVFLVLLVGVALTFLLVQKGFVHATAPSSVTATDFYLNSGTDPWGTTFDSQGNLWVAVPGCDPNPMCGSSTPPGKIEEYNASTTGWMQTLQLPAGYGQALFLAFDSKGKLWFASPMSNAIEMYNPSNHTFHRWTVPTASALPWDIVIDHNGKIWFTEHGSNKIGSFAPGTHVFKEIATPATNSNPYGITVDSQNHIWFTENTDAVARIGKYLPSTGKLVEYKIRTGNTSGTGLTPHLITVDHNGNIWWSEGWVGAIAELNVSQAVAGTNKGVTEHFYNPPCSTCNGTHTSGIAVNSQGNIWFDDSLQSIFGAYSPSSDTFALYNTPTPNSHPYDGLTINASGSIWFDEEFVNKLAKGTSS